MPPTAPDAILTIAAHAKLNLALAVGPPTPPKGYHPIASWFVAVNLHDTLRLQRLPDGTSSTHIIRWADASDGGPIAPRPTPIDWPVEKDLAVRAHRLIEAKVGRELPMQTELIKRTPVGGGLGGGSADAAAMLMGVNRLFSLNLSHATLVELSTRLGADVAFFLDEKMVGGAHRTIVSTDDPPALSAPRPALVSGFGEIVERTDAPPATDVLLLLPPFGCPTAPVYQAFDARPVPTFDASRVRSLVDDARRSARVEPAKLFNDLADPACAVEPRLRDMLRKLTALKPHIVHVTGSGSTMFLIPEPSAPTSLDELAARAEALVPELIIVKCSTM